MTEQEILTLFDRFHRDVYRLAYSYTGNRADAEDVTQETFLRLVEKQPQLIPGKEKAWLLQVCANACKNLRRSPWRSRVVPMEAAGEPAFAYEPQSALFEAVMTLSPKERLVVHLHYYEGYGLEEICAMLRLPLSTVSMRLHRARTKLKQLRLEEYL